MFKMTVRTDQLPSYVLTEESESCDGQIWEGFITSPVPGVTAASLLGKYIIESFEVLSLSKNHSLRDVDTLHKRWNTKLLPA